MSHTAIAAALALDGVSAGKRLAAFSLASFADPDGHARPGTPAAAARAGPARSAYLQARGRLVQRGPVVVEVAATGRGRASTLSLPFANERPWWEGEINARKPLEAMREYLDALDRTPAGVPGEGTLPRWCSRHRAADARAGQGAHRRSASRPGHA